MRRFSSFASCAVRSRYESLVAEKLLQPDAAQAACVAQLSRCLAELTARKAVVAAHSAAVAAHAAVRDAHFQHLLRDAESSAALAAAAPRSWLASLSPPPTPVPVDRDALMLRAEQRAGPAPVLPPAPKGLYLHGGVGVGKTLLADLLFDAALHVVGPQHARRLHFNHLLQLTHYELHRLHASSTTPVPGSAAKAAILAARRRRSQALSVAAEASNRANAAVLHEVAQALMPGCSPQHPSLLLFDEFSSEDAFTAVALKGVIEALFSQGVTVVLTSNRAPADMQAAQTGGAQAALFDAFAATLSERCHVWNVASGLDYRRAQATAHDAQLQFSTTDVLRIDALHHAVVAGADSQPAVVDVLFGRKLLVPDSRAGVARMTFSELCAQPRGSADYIALASSFHTVFLDGVPQMTARNADLARRFLTLIDELYNQRCALVFTAAVPREELFATDAAGSVDLEALQFETAAEGGRLRRDLMRDGGVAPMATSASLAAHSGAAERFAFARAVSRLAEMGTAGWVARSRAPAGVRQALLRATS